MGKQIWSRVNLLRGWGQYCVSGQSSRQAVDALSDNWGIEMKGSCPCLLCPFSLAGQLSHGCVSVGGKANHHWLITQCFHADHCQAIAGVLLGHRQGIQMIQRIQGPRYCSFTPVGLQPFAMLTSRSCRANLCMKVIQSLVTLSITQMMAQIHPQTITQLLLRDITVPQEFRFIVILLFTPDLLSSYGPLIALIWLCCFYCWPWRLYSFDVLGIPGLIALRLIITFL